jgi:hypothetical protein
MNTVRLQLQTWHKRFAGYVRARDFEGGLKLFDPDCRCFGTLIEFAENRERLLQSQWLPVWSGTRSFSFLAAPFEVILSGDRRLACVLTLWESKGVAAGKKTFLRRGRCSTVLRRVNGKSARWLAVHTHFSLKPNAKLQAL